MSDQEEDLELQALQRQLDDAFETTRPRRGFEDDLWARMQAQRPAGSRLRDAWLGLIQGIREVPTVPAAAVAAVLVVALGIGLLAHSGFRVGGGTSSSTSLSAAPAEAPAGSFGRLPAPAAAPGADKSTGPTAPQGVVVSPAAGYAGPVALTWTGKLDLNITSAPVFRYQEPSTYTADQFATSLGAVLEGRPAGFLGSYDTIDLNVRVRGTVQSPAREASFVILPIASVAPIDAAGGPANAATVFLAEHSLVPSWQYATDVVISGDQAQVTLQRQFAVPSFGYASLVDPSGRPYGIEVDLTATRPTQATGPLPLSLDSASYPIISSDEAVRLALASATAPAGSPNVPTVALTDAQLVYTLVVAGDHSFFEPSILFSGSFKVNGTTYVKRVLVPAVQPSQRSS